MFEDFTRTWHSGSVHLCDLAVPERLEALLQLVLFEAFPRMNQMASITLLSTPLRRICSAMDPELWVLINQWLELMNCEDLHAIVAALVVSSTARTCVLICFYTNDSLLKQNGEETCVHLAASHGKANAAMDLRAMHKPAAADGITDGCAQHLNWPLHFPGTYRCAQSVDQALLLMNREDIYRIVGTQVVANTRCTIWIAYHFVDESMLKRSPEETHHYTAASFGVTQGDSVRESDSFSVDPSLADGCRICDRLSLTVCTRDPLAAKSEVRLYLGTPGAACGSLRDIASVGTNDAFPPVSRMEVSDAVTDALQDYYASNICHGFCNSLRQPKDPKCMGQFHSGCSRQRPCTN
ncbi:hypothetical protein HPB51_025104 [Rhipicephalus microplus]|uniref:Uncharacterized protein n=1 Tax=Rhipicephalus microplus TaxID=6941 RepID=A0A9J6DK17_RHIMP|nr:hypothetical protein HPB51_025104 [Rhipicephalus microplus]